MSKITRDAYRITTLAVRGFKSISDEQRIDIRPLTILAGANSSGKSSIMQPLLMLKQTLEAQGDPGGALQLDGANVRFTSADQLLNKKLARSSRPDFMVRIEETGRDFLELVFRREEGKGFDIERMIFRRGSKEIIATPKMSHEDIMAIMPENITKFYHNMKIDSKRDLKWSVYRERCFLSFGFYDDSTPKRSTFYGPFDFSPGHDFIPLIKRVIHLPGLRGNPSRTYPKSSAGPLFPGTFEQYTASTIAKWQDDKDGRLGDLSRMLEEMGLTWKVAATPIADTQYELKVGRLLHSKKGSARDMVSIADVGFGISQTLPVLVSLLAASAGQLVYLEQPEIHLHPKAQRKLAYVLAKAIARGVVVVVETHSSLLLREVQTLVARNEIEKKDVKLHWFRRCEDGSTKVISAELDKNGAFGDWPEDFDTNELEAESNYLDAVEAQGGGK